MKITLSDYIALSILGVVAYNLYLSVKETIEYKNEIIESQNVAINIIAEHLDLPEELNGEL